VLSEVLGCQILKKVFAARGYRMESQYLLELPSGARVHLDGYDPEKKMGFEYITSEAGDRQELTPSVIEELEEAIEAGQFSLLLVDELDVSSQEELAELASRFLERYR